jgi:hypothetical protein
VIAPPRREQVDGPFYVLGGRWQEDPYAPEWSLYDRAIILEVDPRSGSVKRRLEYTTPPEACAAGSTPSMLFKASTRLGDRLYACTSTEVLVFRLPGFETVGYVTHPHFNDLHHVAPLPSGDLAVVSTGLDMLLVVSPEGEVRGEYSVNDDPPWTRFSREVDYRKVVTTKPHRSHPNFAFLLDGELWVTRCEEKDAVSVTRPGGRFQLGLHYPHDGVVHDGEVFFTTVDGRVCVFEAATRTSARVIDLKEIQKGAVPLGWCRGIEVLDRQHVVVGFSKLRRTRWKEKLSWLKRQVGFPEQVVSEPCHIACYDLQNRERLWRMDLKDHGLDAVFAIHRV